MRGFVLGRLLIFLFLFFGGLGGGGGSGEDGLCPVKCSVLRDGFAFGNNVLRRHVLREVVWMVS